MYVILLLTERERVRSQKFSDLVSKKFPHAVRLSCHAHSNAGPKFALNLFPGSGMSATPVRSSLNCLSPCFSADLCQQWHNVIFERADGSLTIGHRHSFDDIEHEVVYKHGRPYYLRELTDAYAFGASIDPLVTFTRHYPFGLIIAADPKSGLSFNDLPMDKIRGLVLRHSALIIRGFKPVDRDDLVKKSGEMGEIVYVPSHPFSGHNWLTSSLQYLACIWRHL